MEAWMHELVDAERTFTHPYVESVSRSVMSDSL